MDDGRATYPLSYLSGLLRLVRRLYLDCSDGAAAAAFGWTVAAVGWTGGATVADGGACAASRCGVTVVTGEGGIAPGMNLVMEGNSGCMLVVRVDVVVSDCAVTWVAGG